MFGFRLEDVLDPVDSWELLLVLLVCSFVDKVKCLAEVLSRKC